MRIILAALLLLMSSVASARRFDSKPLAIAAGVIKRMPNGPCLRYRNFVPSPYRVGFQDARAAIL